MENFLSTGDEQLCPEIREFETYYLLIFNAFGVDKKNITIKVIDNEFLILVKKSNDKHSGYLKCSFVFPRAVQVELARAICINGYVKVLVPKRLYVKETQIAIQSERPNFWARLSADQDRNYDLNQSEENEISVWHMKSEKEGSKAKMELSDRSECL